MARTGMRARNRKTGVTTGIGGRARTSPLPSRRAENTGRKTTATSRLKTSEMQSGSPIPPKITRAVWLPVMKMRGRKTTTVVSVASVTARAIWYVPTAAASSGLVPSLRRRTMFSITTTELSTSIPMPSVTPSMVRTLNEPPVKYS